MSNNQIIHIIFGYKMHICASSVFLLFYIKISKAKKRCLNICVCIYTYTHIQLNVTQPQKEWNNDICSYMDGPRDDHTKQNKPETETNTTWYHLNVDSKICSKWTDLWNRNKLTDTENRLVVAKEERRWGRKELGI